MANHGVTPNEIRAAIDRALDPDDWAACRLAELATAGEVAELILTPKAGGSVSVYGIRRHDGTVERPPEAPPRHTDYVVICRDDSEPSNDTAGGPYVLATRTVFPTLEAARSYAAAIAEARQAMVIPGRWAGLRWDAAERFPASPARRR